MTLKNTLKISLAAIFLLVSFLFTALVSCSGSDDNGPADPNSLVGKWKYKGYYDAEENQFVPDDLGMCYVELFTLNADGTGLYYEKNCDEAPVNTNFEWSSDDSEIYFDFSGTPTSRPYQFKSANRVYIVDDQDGSADVYDRQ